MTDNERILEHTKEFYPDINNLIEKSMINYYHIRMQEEKSEKEEFLQEKLYEQVLDLFSILSTEVGKALDMDENYVYDSLKEIHIKT